MKLSIFAATSVAALCMFGAGAAYAATDTVYNTELGTISPGTTTTDSTGTRSTNSGGTLASEAPAADEWQQRNLRGNGVVGITTDYARNGNGSIYMSTDGTGPSKADMEMYFSTPVLLSDFAGGSYEWYRDSASTIGPAPAPSYRLAVATAQNLYAGYFVFEPYLNGFVPTDTWETETIDVNSSLFWSTNVNANLPTSCSNRQSCLYTLSNLSAANAGMKVIGLSTGAGSGWTPGTFVGAVDNFSATFGTETKSYNFEVAAVPEPATWAMMIVGFGLTGSMVRANRRRQSPVLA